jgi:tryptophan synthase alpha chain
MSRISAAFRSAHKADRAAFVAFLTVGDPTPQRTVELAAALGRAGTDVLELGVPFSDPIADGPTIQRATERALASGTTIASVLDTVRAIRANQDLPIVLFTYANPVLRYGVKRFAADAAAAGADGVLFTDVPVEEMARFRPALASAKLDPVLLVTPTSTRQRIKMASRCGRGFLYLVSRTGVTGTRDSLDPELEEHARRVRKTSRLPVAVGFGISTPAQVAAVAAMAEGVVIGSAIVEMVGKIGNDDRLAAAIEQYVAPLVGACKRVGRE